MTERMGQPDVLLREPLRTTVDVGGPYPAVRIIHIQVDEQVWLR